MTALSLSMPAHHLVQAEQLSALVEAFLAEKRTEISQRTYTRYANDLVPFQQWWSLFPDEHHHELKKDTFTSFLAWCKKDYKNSLGNPSSTYTLVKGTIRIRQFLNWLHTSGCVQVNITDMCPLLHDASGTKYYPDVEELQSLFASSYGPNRIRDTALMAFALTTGARRSEIEHSKIENVVFDSPITDLTLGTDHAGHVLLEVTKKDNAGVMHPRVSVFDSKTGLLLKCWIRSLGEFAGSLFGLGEAGIRSVVHECAIRADLPEMHPHAFRSALIDWWVDKNAQAGMLADIAMKLQVGHAMDRSQASMFYIDTRNRNKVLERIRRFHTSPLEKIDFDWQRFPVTIKG